MASRFLFLIILFPLTVFAQSIETLTGGNKVSLRGLSVVSDQVIWASGTGGTVVRSIDGGQHWEWLTVKGFEKTDFRDIEAFDEKTAVIMGIADPGYILRTTDGGQNWKVVFKDTTKGVFMDAMAFDGKSGVVIGDPLTGENATYLLTTTDGGRHWNRRVAPELQPQLLQGGEAMFASSGTNLVVVRMPGRSGRNTVAYIVTGGKASSFIHTQKPGKTPLPLQQGKESTGANSIAAWDQRTVVVVGGDFMNDKDTTGNACLSNDGGQTWQTPLRPPHGYRSCVAFLSQKELIACGTSGVDLSADGGMNWNLLSKEGFHVCQKARKGTAVFLAGSNGRIARLRN